MQRTQQHPQQPTPTRATEPLPYAASAALNRLELAFAPTVVTNLDHFGSLWGHSTATDAEAETAKARTEGATVEEWETTNRDSQPLRIVRVTHPKFGIDIRVLTTRQAVTA